ncbi:hypothetical protein QVD17_27171 [Tagetes erecta]|uniref:Bifunctional inhibitor/plant lipid transfer protein/seed storage helical domain-containing protein n=1 Tax=Tagetes erecta TaxID=13708 RepID=A0AAD8K8P4_TARER|nr:hypothetical protein QVD17_27171 [Tagetes erecta]
MTKLALFALAIIAFSAVVSAYKTTIITTTIDDTEFPGIYDGSQEQCRMQVSTQELNHCQKHLTENIKMGVMVNKKQKEQQHLQQCCGQLKKVSEQCQCDAIQRVFDQARSKSGVIETRQMLRKAQNLPNECGLEVQDCPLVSPRV